MQGFGPRGWLRIILCTVGNAVSVIPIAVIPVSVLLKPLNAAMGWGRGEISLMLTCITLSIAITLPWAGKLIDRFGIWKMTTFSLVFYGLGILSMPFAIDHFGLAGLYGLSCLNGALGSASSSVVYCKLISGWFDKGRGLALGCAMCGVALGAALTPFVAALTVQASGWRAGFYVLAMFPLLIGLPVIAALRSTTGEGAPITQPIGGHLPIDGQTFGAAARTSVFFMLFVVFLTASLAISAVQIHLAALLSDRGLSPSSSAAAVSAVFLISVPTRIVVGLMFDRMFAPLVGSLCFAGAALGMALLVVPSTSAVMVFSAIVLLGVGIGAENDLLAYIVGRYFGMKAFAQIYGALFATFMVGNSIGPYLMAIAYDAQHNYFGALLLCATGLGISALLLFFVPGYSRTRLLVHT